jgi:5-methylcytosine-specific restriction enzyme B
MTDQIATDETIVTIGGKQYNRLLAEEMARDIGLAHTIRPGVWAIGDNSSLLIGNMAMLSFSEPILHGYLVDSQDVSPEAQALIERYGSDPGFKEDKTYRFLKLPNEGLNQSLELLRPTHEAAVKKQAGGFYTRCLRWKWHNFEVANLLEEVVGHPIPEPSFAEELRALRAVAQEEPTEAPPPDVSSATDEIHDPTPAAARQMARTILAAHKLSTTCWALYPAAKQIVLMVGNCVAGGSNSPGKFDFVLSRDRLDASDLARFDSMQVPKVPKGYPSLSFPRLDDDESVVQLETFQDAHTEALNVLTETIKTAAMWYAHSNSLKQRVEALSGITLPTPTYPPPPLPPPPPRPKPPADFLSNVRSQFAATGLSYTDAQAATFVTALQTKGFVVLSGISGTGKSKIATGFVEMLPNRILVTKQPQNEPSGSLIAIEVTRTTIVSALVNFPVKKIEEYPAPAPGERLRIPVTFGGVTHDCLLSHMADRGHLYRLYFSGELRRKITNLPLGTILYFKTLVDDEGLTISGFEVFLLHEAPTASKTEEELSVPDDSAQRNHLFLSVRPDWRDSTSLLGYYNPLTQTYEWTDFLHFIIRAADNYRGLEEERIAWFVILDEMNLAHVEYYFADLLSVLESGRDAEGWTREPLRTSYPDLLEDDGPPRELRLPPNLYIIGTVNMDETTHAFSPKVLDRAFTIELTEVDFRDYPPPATDDAAQNLDDGQRQALLGAFSRNGRFHRIDKAEFGSVLVAHPELRQHLQSLNTELQRDRFHFGYRVFDEIAQYLAVNDETGVMPFREAFDQAVFMKVMPKFSGSRARLRSPLLSVLAWALYPSTPHENRKLVESAVLSLLQDDQPDLEEFVRLAAYPVVAARATRMLLALESDGFVSFG